MIQAHYCSGELAAIQIFQKASCCCDNPNNPVKDDCCKDEVKTLNIQTAQIKAEQDEHWMHDIKIVAPKVPLVLHRFLLPNHSIVHRVISPKPPQVFDDTPLYTQYHSFLFYG